MSTNRRSFVRELISLAPKVETEFAGQITLSPLEEVNVGEVLVEITPSKGYYAQATFIFQIQATPNYPFQKPIVSCLTSIFHPNVCAYIMEQNVCLNFLNNWSPRYGLKDLLHALLFLFYEPNFDDPWNGSAANPEDGLTMEETIRKSFHGGLINGVRYEPNTAWLIWSAKNASESADHSPKKECLENSSNLLNGPTTQHQQQEQPTTVNYFRETLSGQYASMIAASNDGLNYYCGGQFTIEFAHICRIIVRSTASDMDSAMSVNNFRCYYNAEQCSNDQEERINTFNTLSVTAFTVERHQLEYGGQQSSVYRSWFLYPIQPLDDEPFSDQPLGDSPIFDVDSAENAYQMIGPDYEDAPCLEELGEERSADEQEEPEQPEEPCARTVETVDGVNTEDQNEVELLNLVHLVSESATNDAKPGISNEVPTTESQNDGDETVENVLMAIGPSDSPTITANNADSIDEFVEDEWQGIENVDGARSETNSNMEDDELDNPPDANICREMFQSQKESARRLCPCWWILYQSRWPAYLAPHHMTKIRRIRQRNYFSRASSFVLRSDLFRLGSRCEKGSVFFLVDSLSLSPFSPIVNRAFTIPDRKRKTVTWYGLDWYSVSDAFRPIHNHQSITPRNHLHIPILPFSVFYLHNWIAYMSRVELYGSGLGYSRPLNAGTLSSMGSTCLSPASLGCGQCCYADGWPLWLLWRVSRVLSRFMAFCCMKPVRLSDGSDLGSVDTNVSFPFSDLDEI